MTCREGRGSMFIAKSNEEKRSMEDCHIHGECTNYFDWGIFLV